MLFRSADSPAHFLGDYDAEVCNYRENVFVGYRWFDARDIVPLFPFGHGLSYTRFEYADLAITPVSDETDAVAEVRATVRNAGDRAGKEVVQLYVRDLECSVPRPPRELKGFEKVDLGPGAEIEVGFRLTRRDLSFFHPVERRWTCEPGEFRIELASSSRDIRLEADFTV